MSTSARALLSRWIFPAIVGTAVSCSSVSGPYGEAEVRESPAVLGLRASMTRLPVFDFGYTGTYDFEVSGLPEPSYPYKLRFQSRLTNPSGWPVHRPWEKALISVSILPPDKSRVLASTTFEPRIDFTVGRGEYDCIFWPKGQPKLPPMRDYVVRVRVLEPSFRKWDEGYLLLR